MALALPIGASAAATGQSKAADFTPFDNPSYIKMTPEQGVVKSLHEFTVSVPSAEMLDFTTFEDVTLIDQPTGKTICSAELDYGGMTDLTITLDQEITAPGSYVLVIPEGTLFNDSWSSGTEEYPETKWLYIIEDNGPTPGPGGELKPFENDAIYTISPAQGTVKSLSELILAIDTPEQVWMTDWPDGFVSDAETGEKVSDIEYDFGDTDQEVVILIKQEIKTAGTYIVNIPEGDIFTYDSNFDETYFPASKWLYTVEPGDEPVPGPDPEEPKPFDNPARYTMHPAQGEVGTLQTFYLEVADCGNLDPNKRGEKTVLTNFDTKETVADGYLEFLDGMEGGYDDYTTLKFVLDNKLVTPGTYVLTIPAGAIEIDYYEANPELKFLYTVTGQEDPTPGPDPTPDFPAIENPGIEIDPAQGVVEELAFFTVTFIDEEMVFIDGFMPTVYLKDEATGQTVVEGFIEEGSELNTVDVWLDEEVTTDGTYILEIPGGLISGEEDYVDDILFRYRIGEEPVDPDQPKPFDNPAGFSMFPDQGVVTSMRQFVIEYSDAAFLDWDADIAQDIALINQKTGEKVCGVTVEEDGDSYISLVITLDQTVSTPGTYVLDIPEGALYDYMDPTTPLPATKWLYIIEGDEPVEPEFKPFENDGVVINPEQGKYTSLESFELLFDIQMPAINSTKIITLVDNASGEVVANGKATEGAVLNSMLIDLDKAITTPGAYTLVCPEGTFYNGGSWDEEDLPEFKFAYIVAEDGEPNEPVADNFFVNPDPADGEIGTLDRIIITYPNYSAVYKHTYCEGEVTVKNADGTIVAKGELSQDSEGAPNEILITFSQAITERGTYTVNIPKRAMTLGDMSHAKFSAPIELTYQVSGADGISDISVDINGDAELYNLQGIRVNNPAAGQVYLLRKGDKFVKVLVK